MNLILMLAAFASIITGVLIFPIIVGTAVGLIYGTKEAE
jgi:hypothetical protein